MIDRKRERAALDGLKDLIHYMAAVREGRTAVIAVTDGWLLYQPNEALTHLRIDPLTRKYADPTPGTPPPIGVGPGGTLTAATGERTDASSGQRWLTADLTLAPLGAGDYVIEITAATGRKTLLAVRVTQ